MLPLSVRTYVLNIRLSWRRQLSNSNIFYQNFMKLGHIVYYYDVFFKYDNSPYRTRLSRVMALCLWKFIIWNDVRSLTRIFFVRISWNLVTLFITMMSSWSSIMVHISPGFQELWPFVYEIYHLKRRPLSNSNIFYQNFMKHGHIVYYHNVFFNFNNSPYRTRLSRVMALCFWKFTIRNDVRSLTRILFIRILWNLVT